MGWPKGKPRNTQGAAAMPPLSISEPSQEPIMANETKAEAKTPVKLLYAYWIAEDDRVEEGTIIELPVSEARKLIEAGKAERADKFPGE
jgi:hypothetical protein